uniref:B30.2/SPRY domain-containing protein n=1 Tax=Globodera pallida TaxID=36090 RepID=A0A183BUQ2_GLOPA
MINANHTQLGTPLTTLTSTDSFNVYDSHSENEFTDETGVDVVNRFSQLQIDQQAKTVGLEHQRCLTHSFNRWNLNDRHPDIFLIKPDFTVVQCHGHGEGFRSFRAESMVPNQYGIFYYEVLLYVHNKRSFLGVGFATKALALDEFVGQGQMSFGYGSNGTFWNSNRFVQNKYDEFSRNDIVGCGLNYASQQVFFTLNGKRIDGTPILSVASLPKNLYPCATVYLVGDMIEANFGPQFLYNLADEVGFSAM